MSSRRRWSCAYFAAILIAFFFLLAIIPLPKDYRDPRDVLVQHVTEVAEHIPHTHAVESVGASSRFRPAQLANTKSKHAYATFLASDAGDKDDGNISQDKYFVAIRILAYQLLHAPETRTKNNIPFIVLVNEGVSELKRERLRRDGAIVWLAPPVDPKWIKTEISTWQAVLTKLRLWELTQFERICFLDGDTVLTRSIDGIFDDPAVQTQQTGSNEDAIKDDEWRQPSRYAFAGVPEMMKVCRRRSETGGEGG